MDFSIIIPSYNNAKLLQNNLPEVIQAILLYCAKKHSKAEIIIVDDNSHDETQSVIGGFIGKYRKSLPIIFIQQKKNRGFSSTVNRGVKESQYPYIVLLNTDVIPSKEFLFPLMNRLSEDNVFGVGCLDESIEENKVVLRGRGIGKWERGFLMHRAGELDKVTTLWVSGGSSAFNKSLWNKLHWLDEIYNPFYWEDIDISYRALKSGYTLFFEKQSIVRHTHEQGAIKKNYSSFTIKAVAYKNQFLFVWKNIYEWRLLATHFFWLPYHILKAILHRDYSFICGFFYALLFLHYIILQKSIISKMYLKTDTEVLTLVRE